MTVFCCALENSEEFRVKPSAGCCLSVCTVCIRTFIVSLYPAARSAAVVVVPVFEKKLIIQLCLTLQRRPLHLHFLKSHCLLHVLVSCLINC